jgi:dihydrodipicolinate synthase/N-acetylneuraminate lyase
VVALTGASRGIGLATAGALCAAGYAVVAGARDVRAIEAAGLGAHVRAVRLDLTDGHSIERFADAVGGAVSDAAGAGGGAAGGAAPGGGLAALINNAGVGALGAAEEFPLERARELFEINLWGAARLAQLLLPLLRAGAAPERPAYLVNVGSLIANYPVPFHAVYAASKGALRAYTLALRGELAGHGVAAVLLEPGDIATGTTPLQHAAPGSSYGAAFERVTAARAARMAEHAAEAGVDAICCVPPFFYRSTDEAIVEHYRVVGGAADLPLFVYNLPSSTGVDISPDLMKKIQDNVPQLRGLKHSSPHFARVRDFADMGLDCFIGSAYLLLPGMTIGACGMIDGPPNAAPELWVDIWNAYELGDFGRAQQAQHIASRFAALTAGYPFPAAYKALLSDRLGIECGQGRPPNLPLTPSQKAELIAGAAAMGVGRVGVGVEAAGND